MNNNHLEEQKLNLSNSSANFRRECQICCQPYSWRKPRVALKCFPSQHQLCTKCLDDIIEAAERTDSSPMCPWDRKPFTEDGIISDLTSIDVEEDIHRKNSQQSREKRPLEEIFGTVISMGEGILSNSVKQKLIRNAAFRELARTFKAAYKDLDEFVEVRATYIKLLKREAWKLKLEQIVKAISLPVEIAGLALAPISGGWTLTISGGAAGVRFITAILLQQFFSGNKEIRQCTEKCKELAERPAIQEFIRAFEKTQKYLNGEPVKDLLTAFGLNTVALLVAQAYTIVDSVVQFLGSQVFSVGGELLALFGVCLAGVGAVATGFSIYTLQVRRKKIKEMIKDATKQQIELNKCMKEVKKDPRFVPNLEKEVETQAASPENSVTSANFEGILLCESEILLQRNINNNNQL